MKMYKLECEYLAFSASWRKLHGLADSYDTIVALAFPLPYMYFSECLTQAAVLVTFYFLLSAVSLERLEFALLYLPLSAASEAQG